MIRLFTTYYRDERPERREELDLCLVRNVAAFDAVHVISEGVLYGPEIAARVASWDSMSSRPKYRNVLEYARGSSFDDVVIIANCDIVFPRQSLEMIAGLITPDVVFCLTRWEPGVGCWGVDYSQDSWCFRGPPMVEGGGYYFGVPGCDNRFAAEAEQSRYRVLNPARTIESRHVHATGLRTATNTRPNRVGLPYLYVAPHALGDLPAYRRPTELPAAGPAVYRGAASIIPRGWPPGRAIV